MKNLQKITEPGGHVIGTCLPSAITKPYHQARRGSEGVDQARAVAAILAGPLLELLALKQKASPLLMEELAFAECNSFSPEPV